MFSSYLSLTLRNILRRPFYTSINILGLTLGIATAVLTVIYLKHELTYDHFHPRANKIYRISGKQSDTWFANLSPPYSYALYENQFPEVTKTVRVRRWPPKYIRYGNELFYERKVLFTDSGSEFFHFFDFAALQGNLQNALREPNSVVLTESVARAIFGSDFKNEVSVIGKDLLFDSLQLRVTAVIEDLPSNSHFDFKVLIANDQAMARASGLSTYCMIAENADQSLLKNKLMSVAVASNDFAVLQDCKIIPLRDLHFEGNLTYEMKSPGSKLYLFIFAMIGSAILALSCFNFINLSVAVYAQRTKEIAIRKVVGASRNHLSAQFIVESLFITTVSFPVTLLLVYLVLPFFGRFMGIELQNFFVNDAGEFFLLFGLTMMVGLISGSYPAFVLPRINSLLLFKKGNVTAIGSLNLRSGLVCLQVTAMIVMLSGTWIIQYQMNFMEEKDLGFEQEGVIKLKGAWSIDSLQYARIKSRLLENPAIVDVSQGFAPGDEDYGFPFKSANSDIVYSDLITFGTDADYIRTLGLEISSLQEGTSLGNTRLVLINETLAKRLGYEDPIGHDIIISPGKKHQSTRTIDGVFRDFHFFSLHQSMPPMMLTLRPFANGINENILVKVNTKNLAASLNYINTVVKEAAPNVPLTTEFLDESLARLYEKEQKLSFFSTLLLLITVFLSALGLVGLSSYMAGLKTKEIGIRKVLGASVKSILMLLSTPFVKMVMISFVIGSLISFYLMYRWLESFAYRIFIPWPIYIYTLAGLLVLLLLTVGVHALRASYADPVKSLRSE